MSFAIELNKRQSSRTIEQAFRRHIEIMLETRAETENAPLVGELYASEPDELLLDIKSDPGIVLDNLIGVYVEAHFQLGEFRYLFSTHVADVTAGQGFGRLVLSRPETVMVLQRRRFWRSRFAASSEVRLISPSAQNQQPETIVGDLCNISPDGLALRIETAQADGLLIGDTIQSQFQMPGLDHDFAFDAIVCNKTPGGTPESLLLGLQFTNLDRARKNVSLLQKYLRQEIETITEPEIGE